MLKRARFLFGFLGVAALFPMTLAMANITPERIAIQTQMENADYKGAIKSIIAAQKSGQDDYDMRTLLVEAYGERMDQISMLKKLGLAKKMRAAMEAALELGPNEPDAIENLMQFHLQAPSAVGGDKAEAAKLLTRLGEVAPVRALLGQAMMAREADKPVEAEGYIQKVLEIDPSNQDALLSKGLLKFSQKDYVGAISAFETCAETLIETVDMAAVCNYQIGKMAQLGEIQTQKGIDAFGLYFASQDENIGRVAYGHYRLGKLYEQSGDVEAARAQYEKSITLDGTKDAKTALRALK